MKEHSFFRLSNILVLLLAAFFAACAQMNAAQISTQAFQSENTTIPTSGENITTSTPMIKEEPVTQSENDEPEATKQSTATLEATPTPLPLILRELPEDFNWKELPIQPQIDQNAIDIYEHGLSLGRDPNHVSVIGDCQAIPFVFLGRYGLKQYTLSGTDTRLETMIEAFRDSFGRNGAAVRGGFTAAAVLSPVRADPDMCMPGENPLECEWRIHNPSVVFINLETWREEGTVDRYELYLQKIVEFTLEQGSLPIIIMKADKAESETHVINPAMARVAYQYDVPIINFWQAVQYIDNRGIDPERDGFHLSEEGYHLKEILALRTLYELWSPYQTQAQTTRLPSPTPTMTPTPLPVEPKLAYPDFSCEKNCLFYDLFVQSTSGITPAGIYEFDLESLEKHLIAKEVTLMDISSDQNKFLITRTNELFLVDRAQQTSELILENLYPYSNLNAYFVVDSNLIIALAIKENEPVITLIDTYSLRITQEIKTTTNPVNLIKYANPSDVYFEAGTCTSMHFCTIESINKINTNTKEESSIEAKERLVFSPNGESMAFRDPQYADESNYYHNPLLLHENVAEGILSRRLYSFPHPGGFRVHPEITEYVYSPDGSDLFVLQDAYSDYFEKSVGLYFYLEDLDLRMVLEYGKLEGAYGSLSPIPVWSPDGSEMILLLINTENDRDFTFELFRKDMLNRFSEFEQLMDPQSLDGYGYPTHAFWIVEATGEE